MQTAALALPSQQSELLEAWVEFLGRWPWDWFGTLTFRGDAIHPESADKRFRVWVSKINRNLFGPRWSKHGQGVRWVRALEFQRRDVLHFHVLLGAQGLSDLMRLSWMDEWDKLAGWARIEAPKSQRRVTGYCAKYVAKGGELDLGGPLSNDVDRWNLPLWSDDVGAPGAAEALCETL